MTKTKTMKTKTVTMKTTRLRLQSQETMPMWTWTWTSLHSLPHLMSLFSLSKLNRHFLLLHTKRQPRSHLHTRKVLPFRLTRVRPLLKCLRFKSITNFTDYPEPTPPIARTRSHSPAYLRRKAISFPYGADYVPRTLTIEAICALPHPAPTHALASSHCMTHLLTGSDDGYIRDYDIFPAVNGKSFLSAPQRHHTGVVEGLLKSAQVRYWWENPAMPTKDTPAKEGSLSSVYSLAMHSDALWALAGSDVGALLRLGVCCIDQLLSDRSHQLVHRST